MLRVTALAMALVALAPGVARGSSWGWPVRGRIVSGFSYSAADPYARGRHRGLAIAAAPGVPVLAACAGRVAFAGSVGRAGPTVSVWCGGLRATYQGLATIAVRAGEPVSAADPLGRLGAAGVLHLGARVGAGRYVDPARLLRAAPPLPPLGPAPLPQRVRHPERPLAPPRLVRPPAVPARAPALAWLGLALLGASAPISALYRRRAKRPATFRAWALRQLR
jgi:hypothetical protein